MVAALGRTATDPQPMNRSVRVFLEGGQTSLVVFMNSRTSQYLPSAELSDIVVPDSYGKHAVMYLFMHL